MARRVFLRLGAGASSAWAATAIVRLHVRHLGAPGIEHTLTLEEPPANAPPGEQLPLV